MNLLIKRFYSKLYQLDILFKRRSCPKHVSHFESEDLENLFKKYSSREKIVVLCNGPSAKKANVSPNNLYLVTNNGRDIFQNNDFLYYVNDGFYVKKILSRSNYLPKKQEILFYYDSSISHKKGLRYLVRHLFLLKNKKIYFISDEFENYISKLNNYIFTQFYTEKKIPIKIQNSGVFLLLFGYFLATKMNKPLEIYGLDLGIGGAFHFDNKGVVGKSVIDERIKKNVKMYLDHIYKEKLYVQNFSNFYPN